MYRYILLSLFISFAFAEPEPKPKLSCSNLAKYAKTDVDYKKMTGSWVGMKQLEFKDGYPFLQTNETYVKHYCYHFDITGKDDGFEVAGDVYKLNEPIFKEKVVATHIKDHPKGYFKLKSNAEKYNDDEAILIEFVDEKHMMYLVCDTKENGENYAKYLYFIAKYENNAPAPISDEIKETLKQKYADVFYITGTEIKPSYFGDYCWEKYNN